MAVTTTRGSAVPPPLRRTYRFTIPKIPPSANLYWRHGRNGVYITKAALEYRKTVAEVCERLNIKPLPGALRITAHCYICDERRDLDNNMKQLADALQSWAFEDDNALVEIHLYRHKAATRKLAKVEVIIEQVGYDE